MPASLARRHLLQGLGATASLAALGGGRSFAGDAPMHVLFVCIDDLNDWVGFLGGHPQARTPNLDRLAARGVAFTNAHCASPSCNPSRTAVLTGIRPSTSGVYDNDQPFRLALPDAITLPQYMRRNGYRALASGKIFHQGDPRAFDEVHPSPCTWPKEARRATPRDEPANGIPGSGTFDWGPSRADRDGKQSDDRVVDWVVDQIGKKWEEPTFLAAGIFRPHLPWYVPGRYFDMFPLDRIAVPEVPADDLQDVPAAGREMAHVEEHERIVGAGAWAAAVQGYLASIAFADAELGRVLDALDESDHKRNTAVVLWSDHGWSLGEKHHWKKFALWEECTRVPLAMVVPGLTQPGGVCTRPVNLLDLMPTLGDVLGLNIREEWEGVSLKPLLQDPGAAWDRPSVTTWLRGNHAVRSERFRYIRYADGGEELYDHQADPREITNLAGNNGYDEVKRSLAAWIPRTDAPPAPTGMRHCLP